MFFCLFCPCTCHHTNGQYYILKNIQDFHKLGRWKCLICMKVILFCPHTHMHICLSSVGVCLALCMSVCLSVWLAVCLSVCLSLCILQWLSFLLLEPQELTRYQLSLGSPLSVSSFCLSLLTRKLYCLSALFSLQDYSPKCLYGGFISL